MLNGGFDADLNLWQAATAGSAAHQPGGADGTAGSVLVSDQLDPTSNEVVGLRQCVALPGPGPYRITGRAVGDGLGPTRDRVRIRWRYFPETTTNDCTGVATQGGDIVFPNGSVFAQPLADGSLNVSPAEFNERTQVELALVVVEGGPGITSTSGRFDQIRIVPVDALSDALFANGFE